MSRSPSTAAARKLPRYVNCWPKPVQNPMPVFIPGGGSVETYDFCLDNTYSYSYLSYSGYLRAKMLMEGYWKRVAERKADESPYRAGFAQVICVADTDAEAERLYGEHVSYFYNRCLHVHPGFADAPGYRTIKTIQSGALSPQFAPGSGPRHARHDLERTLPRAATSLRVRPRRCASRWKS